MTAVTKPDCILDALVTRLQDISTARTYYGGGSYRTTPVTVARGFRFPQQVPTDQRPALFVGEADPVEVVHHPGGWTRNTMRVAVQGFVAIPGDGPDATTATALHNLRADVIAAIAEDPQLGKTCTQALTRAPESSADRPKDAARDGWMTINVEIMYHATRAAQ